MSVITKPNDKESTICSALCDGIHLILRKFQGHSIQSIFSETNPLMASQYFGLLNLLRKEFEEKRKTMDKGKKGKKFRSFGGRG